MRNFYFLFIIAISQSAFAEPTVQNITECKLSFHLINEKGEISPKPYMDHKVVKSIEVVNSDVPEYGLMHVTFTEEGALINEHVTKQHIGKSVAVYCDGKLLSKPRIMGEFGSEAQIYY